MTDWIEGRYEVVIGLEVHCQLLTESKIFSGAPAHFGADPNHHVAAVDLGLPGVLPSLNQRAVECAVLAGLALGCEIAEQSRFARKNYFYPDLPKGYQISQDAQPICVGGGLTIQVGDESKTIRLTRIHMEEDAGKSLHVEGKPYSLVDLNRAGVPLIEIVSEPDLRSAEEAVAYLKELRNVVLYLGINDGNLEEGSFRCDANVSIRPVGTDALGTRCELKNLNSFKFLREAIEYEVERQASLLDEGEVVRQETRLYQPDRRVTLPMRSKEDAHDYRYFPDPDLPPLILDPGWIDTLRAAIPELPAAKRRRYEEQYRLSPYEASVLTADKEVAAYFDEANASQGADAAMLAKWVINEVLRETDAKGIGSFPVHPAQLAELISRIGSKEINGKIAKKVFQTMTQTGESPAVIIEREGLKQVTDTSAIEAVVQQICDDNPENVEQYRAGKTKLLGWFVGQVMRETRGRANPEVVHSILQTKLGE